MANRVAFCVEEETSRVPELVGLDGERLDAQPWLEVYTSGAEARAGVAGADDVDEFWVVSCNDVEPINLAASVKEDDPEMCVRLVAAESCGSLFSRANAAHIDEVLDRRAFPGRYAELKRARSADDNSSALDLAAAEVLEAPVLLEEPEAPSLATQFLQLQPQPAPVTAPSDSRAFILTVVSGSGGAGKSATSAIGAFVARKMGHKTLLLDCDLQFGDVADMVGAKRALAIDEAIAHPERLETELGLGDGLPVLAAPARLEASEQVVRQLPDLIERLAGMFDVIVVNTGASWAEQHAVLLERSSASLFLIDQRVSSVNACRHALELCARCGIAANPFQFALNRCAKGAPLSSIDVSCALQGVPIYELKDGGREVENYLSAGGAADLIEIRNDFATSVEATLAKLLPGGSLIDLGQANAPTGRHSLLHRNRNSSKKRRRK